MEKFSFARCVLVAVVAGTAGVAAADVPGTVELAGAPAALTRLFQVTPAKAEWFAPAFLEQVPIEQVNTVVSSVMQQFGAFKSVDGSGLDYEVHLARGSVHARIVVDHSGAIAGLLIKP
jgi:hypothetical protein